MHRRVKSFLKRNISALGRRTPYLRRVFNALDAARSSTADLSTALGRTTIALQEFQSQLREAERERAQIERARQLAATRLQEAELRCRALEEARLDTLRTLQAVEARWRLLSRQQNRLEPERDTGEIQGAVGWPHADRSAFDPNDAKISILLANYNHGSFIKGNIEAVRAQTYPNWELLIVDDGSTDNSRAIIEPYATLDQRIKPIFLPENRGVHVAIRTAMAAASGTLLYGSAADDYILNDRFFELAIAALVEHRYAAGVFGKAAVVDAGTCEKLWEMGAAPTSGSIGPRRALKAFLTQGMFVPGASSIWRRADVDALGGFDESLGPQADFFLNHALPALNGAIFVDDVFVAVRLGTANYHHVSHEDFFRRHALVERRLRSLDLPSPPDLHWVSIWRERLIDSRLGATRQLAFFCLMRVALSDIEAWESLPEAFTECSTRLLADAGRLEQDLAAEVASARRIFDEVAGPLPLGGDAQEVASASIQPVGIGAKDAV